MSRKVNLNEKLSDEDREYLLNNGKEREVAENDAQFGRKDDSVRGEEMDAKERDERIAELRNELARLENEKATAENPNVAFPNQIPGGNVVDNTHVEGEAPEGAAEDTRDDYDDDKKWTKSKLSEEIKRRNRDREKEDAEPLRTSGTRSELVEELRRDDRELAEA